MALAEANQALNFGDGPTSRVSGPNATEAVPHSKPWVVNLGNCGGTLIGRRFVLTALHCKPYIGQEIVMGDHDQTIEEEGEQKIRIEDVVPMKIDGIANEMKADYEIIVLEKEVKLSKTVQIVNLPKPGSKCPETLQVCGWGEDTFNKTRRLDKLTCLDQICRPVSDCTNNDQLPGFKLCASYPGKPPIDWINSSCFRDSGGPLFNTDENGLTTLYGVVVSPGDGDRDCNGPTIYGSVSDERILKWINETMKKY